MATLGKVMKILNEIPVLLTSYELITFARGIVFDAVNHYLFSRAQQPLVGQGLLIIKVFDHTQTHRTQ
jgi:hypothetical protein